MEKKIHKLLFLGFIFALSIFFIWLIVHYGLLEDQNILQLFGSKDSLLRRHEEFEVSRKSARILTQINKNQLKLGFKYLGVFFSVVRNVIILSIFLNHFDIWLPILLFMEMIVMTGLWTNDKNYMLQFYKSAFTSKFDLFNLIRSVIIHEQQSPIIHELFQTYELKSLIFFNLSGEIVVTLVLVLLSVIIKGCNVCKNSEKARALNSRIRPTWNGLVFCLMPRVAVFSGFQLRYVDKDSTLSVANAVLASIFIILLIIFFALLILQIKNINSRIDLIEVNHLEIGLTGRINFLGDLQFDCLRFSMLYYPVVNYIRLLVGYLCIGFAPDAQYIQFCFILGGQLFYFVICVCCKGFKRIRDSILYTTIQFFLCFILLAIINIGLTQQISSSNISDQIDLGVFIIICLCMAAMIIFSVLDLIIKCQEKQNTLSPKPENFSQNNNKELKSSKMKIGFLKPVDYSENSDIGLKSSEKTDTVKKIKKLQNKKKI